MLEKILALVPEGKSRYVAYAAGGMAALLAGRKVIALGFFGKGVTGLEEEWRKAHPEFSGGLDDRWQSAVSFYEATHGNDMNRKLHVLGIPMIVGGAAGLLLFSPYRPLWFLSASSFSIGWVLNFVGHGIFEKKAPAFADDPLAFLAGPVWDLKQFLAKRGRTQSDREDDVHAKDGATITVIHMEPRRA